jgi:hypothetical protein
LHNTHSVFTILPIHTLLITLVESSLSISSLSQCGLTQLTSGSSQNLVSAFFAICE